MITECEILIPAATENVITSRNADRHQGPDHLRRRQRPDHRRCRRDSCRQESLRHSRHPRQCRRRHRLLLRMGAGPPGIFLEGSRRQRAAGDHPVESFDDVVRYSEDPRRQQPHRGLHAGHDRVAPPSSSAASTLSGFDEPKRRPLRAAFFPEVWESGNRYSQTCHPDRSRATRVVRLSGRIPRKPLPPNRFREFSPEC